MFRHLAVLLACAAPFHFVLAQHQDRAAHLPLYDVDESGTVWAVGSTYKASFGVEGATFIPFFGSRAPRNFPLGLRLSSITVGGEPLDVVTDAPARRAGSTVTFDRGSALEQYAISLDGIEQSFTFSSLPVRGEIVISIGVESELEGDSDGAGLRFESELGHVSYSRAVAFDARGTRIELGTRYADNRIELVVPTAFVTQAALPLVVDPFITSFAIDTDSHSDIAPDTAVEPSSSNVIVVYEHAFSATDHDIYAKEYSNQIHIHSAVVDSTSLDFRAPRVAANRVGQNWLCVAQVGTSPARVVCGRILARSGLVQGATVIISGSDLGDKHAPDVGGDVNLDQLGNRNFFVVWQRNASPTNGEIEGRLVRTDGTLFAGVSPIVLDPNVHDQRPRISKTNGTGAAANRRWNFAFDRANQDTTRNIVGFFVRADGFLSGGYSIAATSADERNGSISERLDDHGVPRLWLAAFEAGSGLRLIAFRDAIPLDTIDLSPSGQFGSVSQPHVTTDGRLWQVTYRNTTGPLSLQSSNVMAVTVSCIDENLATAEGPVPITAAFGFDESAPRIASTLGTDDPYRTFIAYETESTSNLSDIRLAVYDSPKNADEFSYCFGTAALCPCGNGGSGSAGCAHSASAGGTLLSATGTWFVSDDEAVLNVTGLPAGAPTLYFQGTQSSTGTAFGDGLLCVGAPFRRLAIEIGTGDSSSFPASGDPELHTAGLVPETGGYVYYQVWHRDSAAFCTSETFNLSNGLALLWAP